MTARDEILSNVRGMIERGELELICPYLESAMPEPKPEVKRGRGKPPKVSLERKKEMADLAIDWYRREGEYLTRREYIAEDCTDTDGNDVAHNDDERSALERFLRDDKDCQRRLNEIDGR